ncbi:MAG: molybdopterin-dependent oxidoreductase [Acidimicrobiales bacterium]
MANVTALSDAELEPTQKHFRTCPLCEATCGLEITTRGESVVRIRGDRDDVFSKGYICPKGSTLKQLHEDPDLLRTPLVRTGDGWAEVSWDEAFREIEERLLPLLEERGRQSLAMVLGNPNTHNLVGTYYARPVIQACGTFNLFSASTVDQMPKHLTAGLMWGDPLMFPLPDLDRTDYLLMLGANPVASNGSLCTAPDFPGRLEGIVERGGKVVLIDPRRTETAALASEHHFVRPGTDLYLLLAIINELFASEAVDIGRLANSVSGVEAVRDLVEGFSAERASETTGIDAATIRRLASELAAAPTAVVYGRMGNHTVEFGTLTSWAADVINVLTGNLDRAGGVMFASPATIRIDGRTPGGRGYQTGRWASRVSGHPEVNGEIPAAALAEEIEAEGDGQIRAVITIAANPVRSFPNSERLDAAFADLDFMVAVDLYLNETSRHADVILPPLNPLERPHYDFAFEANAVRMVTNYSEAVFEPPEGVPDEAEILARLALVLGGHGVGADPELVHVQILQSMVDKETQRSDSPVAGRESQEILDELAALPPLERLVDFRLRTGRFGEGFGKNPDGLSLAKLKEHPHGIDYGPLVPRLPNSLKTASGTVELAPPTIVDDFARFAAFSTDPSDLLLIGRRHVRSNNSWMHNINVLMKGRSRSALMMNPSDATERDISDGSCVEVISAVGRVETLVELTDDVMVGVVCLPHGWGHDVEGVRMKIASDQTGANLNELIDDAKLDVPSGNAVLNGVPVTVAAASGELSSNQ